MEKDNDFLLCTERKPLAFLQYEIIFSYKDGMKYFKSFNIVRNNEVLQKFYLDYPVKINEETEIEQIIMNYLLPTAKSKGKNSSKKQSVSKENSAARNTIAMDFINQFKL